MRNVFSCRFRTRLVQLDRKERRMRIERKTWFHWELHLHLELALTKGWNRCHVMFARLDQFSSDGTSIFATSYSCFLSSSLSVNLFVLICYNRTLSWPGCAYTCADFQCGILIVIYCKRRKERECRKIDWENRAITRRWRRLDRHESDHRMRQLMDLEVDILLSGDILLSAVPSDPRVPMRMFLIPVGRRHSWTFDLELRETVFSKATEQSKPET